MKVRVPDPFIPGNFLEWDPKSVIQGCGRAACPICSMAMKHIESGPEPGEVVAFALKEDD